MTNADPVFVLLGAPRPRVMVSAVTPSVSPFTGKQLRKVELQVNASGADHEGLLEQIAAARDADGPIVDTESTGWKVVENSYSHTGSTAPIVYCHLITLEEREDLHIDRIVIDGIELTIDRSSFNLHEGVVVLEVLADASAEQHEQIETAIEAHSRPESRYFPVEWCGIRQDPVPMRFGRCLWQPEGGGRVRHLLAFVSEAGDADRAPFVGFNEPQISRLIDIGISETTRLDALISELSAAGVLSDDVVQRIERASREPAIRRRRKYCRTDDVDRFFIAD